MTDQFRDRTLLCLKAAWATVQASAVQAIVVGMVDRE